MDRFLLSVKEVIDGQICTQNYDFLKNIGKDSLRVTIRNNVTYIVGAALISNNRTLMIQEAKESCRGQWYLPLGRLERNESLVEGAQREVLEESGIQFKPLSVACIEWYDSRWMRFIFSGQITGGKLKTSQEEDKESIQADYFTWDYVHKRLAIRCRDIFRLIPLSYQWYEDQSKNKQANVLPADSQHATIAVRVVLVAGPNGNSSSLQSGVHILAALKPIPHIPTTLVHFDDTPQIAIKRALKSAGYNKKYTVKGVIAIEHSGKQGDGVWLTLLATAAEGVSTNKPHWINIDTNQELRQRILQLLHVTTLVPLYTN